MQFDLVLSLKDVLQILSAFGAVSLIMWKASSWVTEIVGELKLINKSLTIHDEKFEDIECRVRVLEKATPTK
jgi:hypothetical protein